MSTVSRVTSLMETMSHTAAVTVIKGFQKSSNSLRHTMDTDKKCPKKAIPG